MTQESGQTIAEGATKDTPTDGIHMHIKIYAPFKVYFDGDATSITAVNGTGPFDILAQHHNFMTILDACEIVVQTDNGEERIPITKGVMHVKADEVIVFLDV